MATSTTATLVKRYTPYTGLTALERSQSGIARAEEVYFNVNDSWTTVGANELYTSGFKDLDGNYGYLLTDVFIDLHANSADPVTEAVAQLRLLPEGILGPVITVPLISPPSRMNASGTTAIGDVPADVYNAMFPSATGNNGTMMYYAPKLPTTLLYNYQTDADPQFTFDIAHQPNLVRDYDVTCYLRFLQYDVDQSYNYVLNSPQLTR